MSSSNQRKCIETLNRQNCPIILKEPVIVGYMSVDMWREYHSDLSKLKFVNTIPRGRLSFDLNHNINKAVKRTTDDNDEKINLLLKFILDQSNRLNFLSQYDSLIFITYRRTLISVMCNAFSNFEPLRISASLYNNNIYLCSLETPKNLQRRQSQSDLQNKFCAWGYKFEQYILSDLPTVSPNTEKPVIENEEFSLYYCSDLGDHRLFYGAQIDGLLATCGSVPNPPNTKDIETNLCYLRNHSFVELKTNREIHNQKQERNFRRYKLLRCWCQCYLAKLKGLLVGFRDDAGVILRLKWFDTEEIVAYCKHDWNPQTALEYLKYFLTFVKNSFKHENNGYTNKPITLHFDLDVNKKINVSQSNEQENVLPTWYINSCKK